MLSRTDNRLHGGDQAQGLRQLFAASPMRVLPVLGADEPHAQAAFAAALARGLAATGQRVCLIDQGIGTLAGAFGVKARYDLSHFLQGDLPWERIVLDCGEGLQLIPAARGLRELADEPCGAERLLACIGGQSWSPDLVLLNAGDPWEALAYADPEGDWLIAAGAGSMAAVAAYATIKDIATIARPRALHLAVCGGSPKSAWETARQVALTAGQFLGLDVRDAGHLVRPGTQGPARAGSGHRPVDPALKRLAAAIDDWRLRDFTVAEATSPAVATGARPGLSWS